MRSNGLRCQEVALSWSAWASSAAVAASLRQLGVHVTAVLSGVGPLAQVLGDEVGSVMAAIHRGKGVELVPNDSVVAFLGDGRVERIQTRSGRVLDCDFAVVGVGIEPADDIARKSGIATENGILVDEQCRTSAIDVYAAGDVANHLHPVFGRLRVEHYNNAERHGRAAARSMLGDIAPYADLHSFWSDQYEHAIEYVGYARQWDEFVVRGSLEERRFLGFYLRRGRVAAVMGLNRGGDPELDEAGELFAAKALVRDNLEGPPAVLADDRVDLFRLPALTSAHAGGGSTAKWYGRSTKPSRFLAPRAIASNRSGGASRVAPQRSQTRWPWASVAR